MRTIYYYITLEHSGKNTRLNNQKKKRKDIIMDHKVGKFYGFLWYFRASEVIVWQ